MANLPIISGELSTSCYPSDPQDLLNEWAAASYVQLDITGAKYVISQTNTPAATERNFLWHNPDTNHVLNWNAGVTSWTMKHPKAAGGSSRELFIGALASIDTYDGGEVGVVSDTTGPMWERDTAFNDRFPLGVGTIAGSPLDTGGSMSVTIAQTNLPNVQLAVQTAIVGDSSVGTDVPVVGNTYGSDSVSGSGRAVDSTSSNFSARYYTRGQTAALGSGTALSVQNSYIGVFILKRTARIYYTS